MSLPPLNGQELVAWVERTSSRWNDLLSSHPEALEFPCDIRETQNVAGLLQHVVAVELRYAERLNDLPETAYDDLPSGSAGALYAIHCRAMHLLHQVAEREDAWWQQVIAFNTRSGGALKASRRVVFFHLLLHSIRHYAQMATVVRQHGLSPCWMMDYLDVREDGAPPE